MSLWVAGNRDGRFSVFPDILQTELIKKLNGKAINTENNA